MKLRTTRRRWQRLESKAVFQSPQVKLRRPLRRFNHLYSSSLTCSLTVYNTGLPDALRKVTLCLF